MSSDKAPPRWSRRGFTLPAGPGKSPLFDAPVKFIVSAGFDRPTPFAAYRLRLVLWRRIPFPGRQLRAIAGARRFAHLAQRLDIQLHIAVAR
jgi:hypothetical protein